MSRVEPADDWSGFLADNPKVLWSLVADVVKAVKASEGERRTGRRPAVSCGSLDELYDVLFPVAYTADAFPVAFAQLLSAADLSQRTFAKTSGYSQPTINRMLAGKAQITPELLEHLARLLGVRPMYFAEYRALKIGQLVTEVLMADPHLSADSVRRLLIGATA